MMEKRCAIYTRKSHEEGLDQEYNSLDAQGDACEAYIKSQAHEGWKLIRRHYVDGGYSGGNLNRPGLKELLNDVQKGKVDVIVVYKIDRLTRSLMDFSKIMDVLDASEASFAAVTQHFNTTTSMGRLTLNVLLSFAQFEREVTGERIRDKFAASKKKGMWMGGTIPLGYDVVDRKLVVNIEESKRVNLIFERYLACGNVTDLVQELDRKHIRNKQWISRKGNVCGGTPFQRGPMYGILQNKLYLGKIDFKGEVYDGEHEAIVSTELWDAVQKQLSKNRKIHTDAKAKRKTKLLDGFLFDSHGNSLIPTYSVKKGNRRYPYYVSAPFVGCRKNGNKVVRIPAEAIEGLVQDRVATISEHEQPEITRAILVKLLRKVTVQKNFVEIEVNHGMSGINLDAVRARGDEVVLQESHALIRINATLRKRDRKVAFITTGGYDAADAGKPDPVLTKNVVIAWKWRQLLDTGEYHSIRELCRGEKQSEGYVRRLLPLSYLAPDIVDSILDGNQPPSLDLKHVTTAQLPLSWKQQRTLLGYNG